jgi:hypothetical protein
MNRFRKNLPKLLMLVVACMLAVIPNLNVYALGSYQSSSMAITANNSYTAQAKVVDDAALPAILAVAAGVGLAVVFAVGVIDGWNSVSAQELAINDLPTSYDPYDFSEFDN